MNYFDEVKRAQTWLGERADSIFLGQAVGSPGTAMFGTLVDVPTEKRIELPVFEETQMGMTIGLSLGGFTPISIFPRWNFLLAACNQLVGHLDKLPLYSDFRPHAIIRTGVGSVVPLHPQIQHIGDFTDAFRLMLSTVSVVRLERADEVFDAYRRAYEGDGSTILVEIMDQYNS